MFPPLPKRDCAAPLATRQLDWSLTTETLFAAFAGKPWSLLLDSAAAPHVDAARDLIFASPIATLKVYEDHSLVTICGSEPAQVSITEHHCPFALAKTLQQSLYPHIKQSALPFSGGAAGAFNYDLGRNIETLPAIASDDIGLPLASLGFYDWALIKEYQSGQWTLVHYLGEAALNDTLTMLQKLIDEFSANGVSDENGTNAQSCAGNQCGADEATKALQNSEFSLKAPFTPQIDRAAYNDKFARVQQYLLSGDCYQINLTQRFSAPFSGEPWHAYRTLRASNKAPFSAFMRLDEGAIVSISPERFLKLSGRHIETKPIKGTLPRSADPLTDAANAEALKRSPKDQAENLMIVDLLRNDIGRVASPGSVSVPKLFDIESFPAVHHLVSTVTGTLADGLDGFDLLKAAFPGGSITGAPKIRAMEIIEELEPSRRSIYCGSIGYLSQHGEMDTSIAIRTLVAKDGVIHCWAGGGVVADSNADAEYQETFDKVSRILPVLEQSLSPSLPLTQAPALAPALRNQGEEA
ncbi:aminodeoxychorismate synthase component I [Shewanella sp. JM162201]|uniref:aminodeoxychorismate synthase n=1 Tax=Shewanella jiangmenensis TaxID=2837387 RepID=A0ABS5V795_9GAMM|nr:aminodeoxychorismate synthase component I [Shewanella jiangmenensis]MBT1445531.1 aminodeoxychorismate synthase component I [Shewanella jiangmenensis]